MLYHQKINTTARGPNELGCGNKHVTNGWMNLTVINVSVGSFLLYPDEPLM